MTNDKQRFTIEQLNMTIFKQSPIKMHIQKWTNWQKQQRQQQKQQQKKKLVLTTLF